MDKIDEFIKFTSKTQGRDKIYRITQYTCKVAGWGLEGYPELFGKLKKLESHASLSRKLFRLGKCVDSFRAAQRCVNTLDPILRPMLTIYHINRAMFLLIDHYLWLGKVGLTAVDKKWEVTSARFFLASILLGVLRDLHALHNTMAYVETEEPKDNPQTQVQLFAKACRQNPAASLDLVRNLCDYALPGSKLGRFPDHPGLVGVCGLVSSLIGAYQLINPAMKLKP